ncbi:MAG TPA: SGNH/GDSL hydrolase family protein [Candidatus Acidoferrum sp.]|jgi:lysophospholipase L1-like esterase|nr:SGNH/GDSL hydrolase family protein [Candidatus Angelobacter sp.]HXD80339.1 SGNH/GDSL hydrolase family protein [Candidatus Acidoferrum sp.]
MGIKIKYLALGDSYTIGTGASTPARAWPSIIAERLRHHTGQEVELTNPAVNGFTTVDLIRRELAEVRRLKPDLVTILIGVNDLVRDIPPDSYRATLVRIYDEIAKDKAPDGRVFAVSIPNWSVVPAAREYGDPEGIRDLTDSFNDIAREEAEKRGFGWIDITAASLSGLGTPGWIASDGLHPGDEQYAAWAEVIWHSVRR